MCIKATVFVFFLSFFDRLVSADHDFLDVNLLDEVRETGVVRGLVSIAWMARPPYLFHENLPGEKQKYDPLKATKSEYETKDDNRASGGQTDPNMKGIFQEIVSKGLQICCRISSENIKYTTEAKNLQQLDQSIVDNSADIFMPVYGSGNDYGRRVYVEVLKSPGVVFIVNKEQTMEHSRKRVWQAMKETWPVLVITLSLAGIAGLLIWGLVSKFPKRVPLKTKFPLVPEGCTSFDERYKRAYESKTFARRRRWVTSSARVVVL